MKNKKILFLVAIMIASLWLYGCNNNTDKVNTESQIVENPTETLTETSTEISTEIMEEKIASIMDLKPGDVFEKGELDLSDLSHFFISSSICEGDEIYLRIYGQSYQPNDDIALEELRYIKLLHYNYDGQIQVGEIIVNEKIEKDCLEIFLPLFEAEYQINRMVLIDDYWTGDGVETDAVSIKKNNTSCFNYRYVPGSTKRSNHALGLAIDINPRENPYIPTSNGVADYSALDEEEYYYATNRLETDAHVITHEDLAYKLFKEHGFTWGGDWYSLKDYQHFEKEW